MKMDEKKSFVFYKSFYTTLSRLSFEQRGKLITAICEQVFAGEVSVKLSKIVEVAFCGISETLERDAESYAERCRQNSENGKKGGRPRKNAGRPTVSESCVADKPFFSEKTDGFFEKAKKADNDNGNGNDNDNDNDNDNVNECENDNESPFEETGASAEQPTDHTAHGREDVIFGKEDAEDGEMAAHSDDAVSAILEKEGIPSDYISSRMERARFYAGRQRASVESVLREWWKYDLKKPKGNGQSLGPHPRDSGSSFDTDEFFDLAVKRSFA